MADAVAALLLIHAVVVAGPIDLGALREELRGVALRQGCEDVTVSMRGRGRQIELEVHCPKLRQTPPPKEDRP